MKSIILSAALTFPAAVLAQCPTHSDLDRGILFYVEGGDTEKFRQSTNGLIEATYMYGPGEGSRVLLAQGIYLVELIDIENNQLKPDTRSTYGFPLTMDKLPKPSPGGIWSVRAVSLDEDGLTSEMQIYRFGAMTELTIGACSYDMIPIEIRYPEDDDTVDFLHYMPALKLSYLSGTQDSDGASSYVYYDISVAD
jgi:hypothetical protein